MIEQDRSMQGDRQAWIRPQAGLFALAAAALLLSSCGSAESALGQVDTALAPKGSSSVSNSSASTHTFSLVVLGQGVTLAQTIIVNQGLSSQSQTYDPPGGGTRMLLTNSNETMSATGATANIQLTRTAGGAATLNVWVYRDGALVAGPLQYTDAQSAQWTL